jgi:LysR family glycine cleavage system transcriptional activator
MPRILQRQLPPFDSLLAFDAALRLRSMTAAAAELGVTQSAVSHRLRRLESFIGTPLLLRRRAGLEATLAGTALAENLGEIFEGLAGLRERSRAVLPAPRLRLGMGAALAQHWLLRRLPLFHRRHPGIAIELAAFNSKAQMEARSADLDLRITWVNPDEARASSTQRLLAREQVFPVCAPGLLKDMGLLKTPLRDPAQLAQLPLLHKGSEGGQAEEWEWSTWFRRLGLKGKPKPVLHVDEIGTSVAAALEGTGVALARSLIVHDALQDGRLVRVLPSRWDMTSQKAHVIRWPAALSGDPRLRVFVDWLAEAASQTITRASSPADEPTAGSRAKRPTPHRAPPAAPYGRRRARE